MSLRREPVAFWRGVRRLRARPGRRHGHALPPELPHGAVVPVPGRGDIFFRYLVGPAGAPTVLLLHGWTMSADLNWVGAFRSLAGRYHVVAVDHRGHGRGMRSTEPFTLEDCADDAAALLDALGIDDAIATGYSMGGPIALLLARRHPDKVSGLVLAATGAELVRTGPPRTLGLAVRLVEPLLRSPIPDRVARHVARAQLPAGPIAELGPWMAGEYKRLHPADAVDAGLAISRFDARPWLHEVRDLPCRTVSIVTTDDRAVRPHRQLALATALDAHVLELGAGHSVPATDPDALGDAVRRAADLLAAPVRPRWTSRALDRWRALGRPAELVVA